MNEYMDKIAAVEKGCLGYYIDALPESIDNENAKELMSYMEKNCLDDYASKIKNIVVKMISYFPSKVFITEFAEGFSCQEYKSMVGEDLRSLGLLKIGEIIEFIIKNNVSTVKILFTDEPMSVISINGLFSCDIFHMEKDRLRILDALIRQENLFLRIKEPDF